MRTETVKSKGLGIVLLFVVRRPHAIYRCTRSDPAAQCVRTYLLVSFLALRATARVFSASCCALEMQFIPNNAVFFLCPPPKCNAAQSLHVQPVKTSQDAQRVALGCSSHKSRT
jgi:hypothetical protein